MTRVVKDGESWARTRRAFSILLEQWGDGATLASRYVGGQSVSRDHKADKDARDPIVPVPGAKQRECLKFLTDAILSDKSFQFSPALLRRLGTERWSHWGSDGGVFGPGVDISVLERILGIQKIVLGQCLSSSTLARLQNQQLQADPGTDPLRMDEVFRSLTDGIWSDLDRLPGAADDKSAKFVLSTIRRNLQREHLRRLSGMVIGTSSGASGDIVQLHRLPARRQQRRAGRRPGSGPVAPEGDCQPHHQGAGNEKRDDRRHEPGSPRRVPSSDRQGSGSESRRPRAVSPGRLVAGDRQAVERRPNSPSHPRGEAARRAGEGETA